MHRTFGVEEDPFLIKNIIKLIKIVNEFMMKKNAILVVSTL